jgi:hypothetical protein
MIDMMMPKLKALMSRWDQTFVTDKMSISVYEKAQLCRCCFFGCQMLGMADIISGSRWECLGVSVSFWE